MSFLEYYFDIYGASDETAVCCPFDHLTESGIPYKEHNPSAHVNLTNGLFHCKVCDKGYNEVSFIKEVLKCSMKDALILQPIFNNTEDVATWDVETEFPIEGAELASTLGISTDVQKELKLASHITGCIDFPVFMFNHLVDVRKYTPNGKPKMHSRTGAPTGLIIPFDIWRESDPNRITLICAGEKDMAVARSHGFNAITITGGEMATPLSPVYFKDRKVVIVYDNDATGRKGAKKLANYLLPYVSWVKICDGFHSVCSQDKEDITDFFTKYNKTKQDLIQFIKNTPIYEPDPNDEEYTYPMCTLHQATEPNHIDKMVRSNIQVVAMSEASYVMPDTIICTKFGGEGDKQATMAIGEVRAWDLKESNLKDMLHLIDGGFKETEIKDHIKALLKIPKNERCVSIKTYNKTPVFKCYVTDLFETANTEAVTMEYTAYSIGFKLESGKKYLIDYKLVPHPYKGQQLTMIITKATAASDTVNKFKLTDEVKDNLALFRNLQGTVTERVNILTQKVKGLIGYDGNDTLIQAIDLSYHTVLNFNFGHFKNVRGYLDTFIVGESRIGKSSTANVLRDTYQLGVFTSLAGASATVPGLIGGSNKQAGTFQTRAGLIPQNHKGLIIFEEFGKSNSNIITELTDIRSSNEVRITRVSGTLTLPATVRMITLTNVKATDGIIKPIATYPNGIAVITELVGTAEDIARYDLLVVLSTKGAKHIDPLWEPETPFSKEAYQARVRWVWSRKPEQVILSPEVLNYIIDCANDINDKYDCHIKIFGTEAWKKISRLAIAVAGYLVSTDDSYENIIVTKEHVDYAMDFFEKLYNNNTFRLKEYVEHERKYSTIDEEGIQVLQDLFIKCPALLLQLEQSAKTNKNTLQAATGLNADDYNKLMNQLTSSSFVQLSKYDIIPTERFRLGMYKINRNTRVRRLGENA